MQILQERAKAGVEIKVIGQVTGKTSFEKQKLAGMRLHTRTIVRDRHEAFVGSQSLRTAEMDLRREVGLIIQDSDVVKKLIDTFESDWTEKGAKSAPVEPDVKEAPIEAAQAATAKEIAKAVEVFTKELEPLASTVKEAVRHAVEKAGDDVLNDKDVKDTMKKVVKDAVKEAVKDAVHAAQDAQPPKSAA